MAKSSQRRKKVTVSAIRALSHLQVSEKEAAASLQIGHKAFREMIRTDQAARTAWEEGRELGKVSLRRYQFELARRNAPMAIFLGKSWLGQNDISTIQHTGADGGPIKTLELGRLDGDQRKQLRDILTAARVAKKG